MKKRMLLVEDDSQLLAMYAAMMSGEGEHWEVVTANTPGRALQLLEQTAFDVVVSDLVMPGMNGVELLDQVKARYPRSSRIMMSGLSNQERVIRSLGTTHQFLTKPFEVRELKATLDRIGGLDAYLNDPKLQTLVGQLGSLPSFPALYVEMLRELDAPNSSIASIAAIVAKDPGMTAKMLQIVNSAALGLAHKIGNPFEAIQFLGIGMVRSLVLSAHIFSCFERIQPKGLSIEQLSRHALNTGMLARRIMRLEHADATDAEEAYTAGVLHDIGKLILANSLPEQFEHALALAAERNIPSHEAEREILGADHAAAAAYLLGLWGLPSAIVEAVAFHHTPRKSVLGAFSPLTAVHVADVLEHELAGAESGGRKVGVDVDYLASIHLEHRLDDWRTEAVSQLRTPHED